jgi:hypothetical protein
VDLHVEAAGAPCDDLADPPHADDAQALAGHLGADHEGRAPVAPFAGAHQTLALAGAPRRTEHEQKGDLGGRVAQHVGGVGDDNAAPLGRLEVDVIDADRHVGDHLHGLGQAADDLGREVLCMAGQDGVDPLAEFDQLVAAVEPVVRVEHRPVVPGEARLDRLGQLARDENAGSIVCSHGALLPRGWVVNSHSRPV